MEQKNVGDFVKFQNSWIFSSSTAVGAENVTDNGSRFTVNLDNPISVPRGSVNCTLEVQQASIWYVSPNISAEIGNNKFYFAQGASNYVITIPDGLYSVSGLNALISRELSNLGLNSDQIILSGDNSTQKTVFTFPYAGTQIDFTQSDTPREILGFNSRLSPAAPSVAGESDTGDVVAAFNQLNSWLIHSTLANNGIPLNNTGANIIAKVPITVSAGLQENYTPVNPTQTATPELIGNSISSINVWLTDQDNRPIDTFGEIFDVVIVLKWYYPTRTGMNV